MHRSSSTSSMSAHDYYASRSSSSSRGSAGSHTTPLSSSSWMEEMEQLPTYDPVSQAAAKKKEKEALLAASLSENMVHIIPLVLILCALVLWFFSYPEINLAGKDDSIIASIKNMATDGYSTWNGSLMTMGLEDLDPIDQTGVDETDRVG